MHVADSSPKVSVLVPICNVEKYLEECLESARVQTLTDIEIICINDGSTDGSLKIIQSFCERDARFRLIDKLNSGYGDSMNKGLDAARGEYVAILESDDFLDSDALEYMYQKAVGSDLEVLKCNFWLYWSAPSSERMFRKNMYFSFASPEMVLMGAHRPIDYPYSFWGKASIWSAIYKRSFLNDNSIRFLPTPGASYQDSSFTFKVLACASRVAYSSKAFLHYRQDNENSSVNSKGKVYCTCEEHAEMERFLNEERPDLKLELDPIRARLKFLNYRWNYDRLGDKFKNEFLMRFSAEMREEIERGTISEEYFNGRLEKRLRKSPDLGHFKYFYDEELEEIRQIAFDPAFYATRRLCETSPSKIDTVKRYFSAGGLKYIIKVAKQR